MAQPLFNTTSFKDGGPLGGFLSGLGDSFALANADRDLADRDRVSRMDQAKVDEFELNSPVRAAARAEALAKSEFETADITSGRKAESLATERDIKLQQAIEKKSENERKEMERQATGMVQASSMITDEDVKNPLLAQAKWDGVRDHLDKHGVKNTPQVFSMEAFQKLRAGGQAATMSISHIQDMRKQGDQQAFTAGENRLQRQTQVQIAEGHDAATIEASKNRASTSVEDKTALKPLKHQMEVKFAAAMEKGEPIDANEMERYIGMSIDVDDKVTKLITSMKPGIVNDLMLHPKEREALAKKAGKPGASAQELGELIAKEKATRQARETELQKFEGAVVSEGGVPVARIKGGKRVPLEGPTPGPAQSAPASSPMAPPTPEIGAAFGSYPSAGRGAPTGPVNPLQAAQERMATPEMAKDRLAIIGSEYLEGKGAASLKKEIETLKAQGKVPKADANEPKVAGAIRLTHSGKLVIFDGTTWQPL